MQFSDASGRKVVSTSSAETVGKVDGFVVDPRTRSIVALELKKTDTGDVLGWSDITAFGEDAVTVSGAERITDAPPDVAALSGKDHELVGKRSLSTAGDELGKVKDVGFDPATGLVTSLTLEHKVEIAGDRLVGVGSYAVVLRAE